MSLTRVRERVKRGKVAETWFHLKQYKLSLVTTVNSQEVNNANWAHQEREMRPAHNEGLSNDRSTIGQIAEIQVTHPSTKNASFQPLEEAG